MKLLKLGYTDNFKEYHGKTGSPLIKFIVVRGLARPSCGILLDDSFLGHVLRIGELEKLVVTGFVDGKRVRGSQRETFLSYLGKMKQILQ